MNLIIKSITLSSWHYCFLFFFSANFDFYKLLIPHMQLKWGICIPWRRKQWIRPTHNTVMTRFKKLVGEKDNASYIEILLDWIAVKDLKSGLCARKSTFSTTSNAVSTIGTTFVPIQYSQNLEIVIKEVSKIQKPVSTLTSVHRF